MATRIGHFWNGIFFLILCLRIHNWHGDKDRALSWVVSLRTVCWQTGQKFSMRGSSQHSPTLACLRARPKPPCCAQVTSSSSFVTVCSAGRDRHGSIRHGIVTRNKLRVQRVLFQENPRFSPPLRNGMMRLTEISLSFYISFARWPNSAFNTSDNAGKNLYVVSHLLRARKRHPKAPKHPRVGVGGTSSWEVNGDVPLDGVAFSRLDWL